MVAEHYSCLVQMLYNAVFVQSLAALTCKFTDEERAAWRTKGRNVSCQGYVQTHFTEG